MLRVLGIAVHNIYFHPLCAYPGPKLWAAFRFPYVYNQFKQRLPLRVKELHDQYGPIVRIAPDELAYISASAWKDIYGFRSGKPQNPKDLMLLPAFHEGQAVDLVRNNEADHTRVRRLLSHAFSTKALEEQQPLITSYVDLLVRGLKEKAVQPQDMVVWFNWTTFDIIGDLTFGESFHCLQNQRLHPWIETTNEGIRISVVMNALRRYDMQSVLMNLIPKKQLKKFELLGVYTKEKVESRLQRETKRPDFISYILRHDRDGKQMSKDELEANAEVFVVAGSDTTASLLSGVTFYLCTNPHVLKKVVAEVRSTFNHDHDMNLSSLSTLDYLSATLTEALRRMQYYRHMLR